MLDQGHKEKILKIALFAQDGRDGTHFALYATCAADVNLNFHYIGRSVHSIAAAELARNRSDHKHSTYL